MVFAPTRRWTPFRGASQTNRPPCESQLALRTSWDSLFGAGSSVQRLPTLQANFGHQFTVGTPVGADGTVGVVLDDAPPTAPETSTRRRLRPGTVLAVLSAVVVLGMWAWVLGYHLSGTWRDETPGRLTNTTFPTLAEPACADAMDQLALLPPAWATPTPQERADTVEASTAVLSELVTRLRGFGTGGQDAAVGEWLADWDTFIADRIDYASRLRSDPDARFYVTQSDRDRRQITLAIDRFANTNAMPSCVTPSDLS